MKKYLFEIIELLGTDKKKLPFIIFIFIALSLIDLAGIGLIGPFVGIVADTEFMNSVIIRLNELDIFIFTSDNIVGYMSIMIVIVFALKSISGLWIHYIITKFSVDQQTRLRILLMNSYQQLPYVDYLNRNSSDYVYSIQLLVNHYAKGVISSSMKMLSDSIVAIMIISFLLLTSTLEVLLLIVIIVPFMYFYDWKFKVKVKRYGNRSNVAASKIIQGIHEGIEGLKEIRILGCEKYFLAKVKDNSIVYGDNHIKSTMIGSAPKYLIELLMVIFVVLLVQMVSAKASISGMFVPTLVMFGVAAMRIVPIVSVVSKGLIGLRFYRDSIHRLYSDVKDTDNVTYANEIFAKNNENFESMSLTDVSYSYNPSQHRNVIKEVDIEIIKGKSIGVIGASGSGKTTLIDIILGLLGPQSGKILINQKDLGANVRSWQHHIAYIPQEIFLIDDTLQANIALGVPINKIDKDRLNKAMSMSKVDEFIGVLPQGIDTMVGEHGVRLSGGQRQRVALARAFYYNRSILVFDEATSALDNEIENDIIKEINELHGLKTMIVIAHRMSTIEHCDYIYKLDHGTIIAKGTPKDILGH
jgi:ATP-binding cassette, subfamily B, bacterial PglK